MNNPWGDVTGIRPVKIARTILGSGGTKEDFINKFKNELNVRDLIKMTFVFILVFHFVKQDVFTVLLLQILQPITKIICVPL